VAIYLGFAYKTKMFGFSPLRDRAETFVSRITEKSKTEFAKIFRES